MEERDDRILLLAAAAAAAAAAGTVFLFRRQLRTAAEKVLDRVSPRRRARRAEMEDFADV